MYKKTMFRLLIALSVALVIVLGVAINFDIKNTFEINPKQKLLTESIYEDGIVTMELGDVYVEAEIALTPDEHQRGLSGRETLNDGEGMLFIYTKPGYYNFWMPAMNASWH